jgi:DNA polymerase
MSFESTTDELLTLIKHIEEHVAYFQELGVELVAHPSPKMDTETSAQTTPAAQLRASPALPAAAANSNLRSFRTAAVSASSLKMSAPQSVTPPPLQDGLFPDIAVQPETIPKSTETLEQIWADVGDCTRCPLHEGRTNIVHTEGNRKARLMFVGEAPGADEDTQGRPFVGRAGQLLTKIIESIGFKREEVMIGNVNRCRPPGNRTPTAEEASICKPFLLREIAAVQPEVIVVLGNTAMKNLLDTREGITRLRGQFQDFKGIKIMPSFHPAYLLRDPSKKRETWDDLKKVRDYLDNTASGSDQVGSLDPGKHRS